jgi:hypothetical protein
MAESISISVEEYERLKKKAAVADDALVQLEFSLKDMEAGRVKRVK